MKYTWITQAINARGQCVIKQMVRDKSIFRAEMHWPTMDKPVFGGIAMDVERALENLETALAEDCANEMLEKGQA